MILHITLVNMNLDTVPKGTQSTSISNHWRNTGHVTVTNSFAFKGFLAYAYGHYDEQLNASGGSSGRNPNFRRKGIAP